MRGIQNTAVGLESVITTENPSRNIADVLAQELSGISTALTTASNTRLHLFNKLWENPSPSSGFAGQTILLDLSGYDFLYVVVSAETIIIPINGNGFRIQRIAGASSAPYHAPHVRDVSATSTGVSFGNGLILNVSGGVTDNTVLVPAVIYGFKKSVDINAIVSSISTDADKCMMSDGVTSVEQALQKSNEQLHFGVTNQSITLSKSADLFDFLVLQTSDSGASTRGCIIVPSALYSETSQYRDISGFIQLNVSGTSLNYVAGDRYIRKVFGMKI